MNASVPKRGQKARSSGFLGLLVISAVVVRADLAAKALAFHSLATSRLRVLIPGVLSLRLTEGNTGGPFGIGRGHPLFFSVFSIVAVVGVLVLFLWLRRVDWRTVLSFGLIAGGALGNLYDRLQFGYVRDFIDLHVGRYHWPTFNLADAFICIGAGLLVVHAWKEKPEAAAEPSAI